MQCSTFSIGLGFERFYFCWMMEFARQKFLGLAVFK